VIYYVFCYYNYVHSVQRSWKYKLNIEINAVVIGKMIMKLLIVLFKAFRIAIFLNKRLYFFLYLFCLLFRLYHNRGNFFEKKEEL